jgi:hypothetical protein
MTPIRTSFGIDIPPPTRLTMDDLIARYFGPSPVQVKDAETIASLRQALHEATAAGRGIACRF